MSSRDVTWNNYPEGNLWGVGVEMKNPVQNNPLRRGVSTRRLYRIDGISVERLFDDIYENLREEAKQKNLKFTCEIIAWEPLIVAADGTALRKSLHEIIHQALIVAGGEEIILRAYPSHDETQVFVEMLYDLSPSCSAQEVRDLEDNLTDARRRIERMGGKLQILGWERRGIRVCFWLPHWVEVERMRRPPWRLAA
jgi:hypothetical protein